jgi:uncharacterized membrane protein YqjE
MHAPFAMPEVQPQAGAVPTTELIRQALTEARELAALEVRIAKEELREELAEAQHAAVAGALAVASALLVLVALLVAVILALGGTVMAALIVAAALAGLAIVSVIAAYTAAPKSLLGRTRQHLKKDAAELKEHVT